MLQILVMNALNFTKGFSVELQNDEVGNDNSS